MNILTKRHLLYLFTFIFYGIVSTAHTNANSITTRAATEKDIKHFDSVLSLLSEPIYLVHLLYRECYKIEEEHLFRKITSKTGASYYLGYKPRLNLLTTDANATQSKETIEREVSSSQLSDCPKEHTYERLKSVYVKGDKTVGWVFETVESYCILPVYLFPKGDKGCRYAYCQLACPENTETKLFSLDKKFAESIQESLKPRKQIDKLDPYEKRFCNELD